MEVSNMKKFLSINDGFSFADPWDCQGKWVLNGACAVALPQEGSLNMLEVAPLVGQCGEYGIDSREVSPNVRDYLFFVTRECRESSVCQIEPDGINDHWVPYMGSDVLDPIYGCGAIISRDKLIDALHQYKPRYGELSELCAHFRKQGFVALARISDQIDRMGIVRSWQEKIIPVKEAGQLEVYGSYNRRMIAKRIVCEFDHDSPHGKQNGGQSGREIYFLNGFNAQILPLYCDGKPFDPIRPLRQWKF
jgi:hypothetical protein